MPQEIEGAILSLSKLQESEVEDWFKHRILERRCSVFPSDPTLEEFPHLFIGDNFPILYSHSKAAIRRSVLTLLDQVVAGSSKEWLVRDAGFCLLSCCGPLFRDSGSEDRRFCKSKLLSIAMRRDLYPEVHLPAVYALWDIREYVPAVHVDCILTEGLLDEGVKSRLRPLKLRSYLPSITGLWFLTDGFRTVLDRFSIHSPINILHNFADQKALKESLFGLDVEFKQKYTSDEAKALAEGFRGLLSHNCFTTFVAAIDTIFDRRIATRHSQLSEPRHRTARVEFPAFKQYKFQTR